MAHWIEDEKARARFWAVAKDEFGLDEVLAHYGLDVESVKDYQGSIDDALATLAGFARGISKSGEEVAEAARSTSEAPFLAWTEITLPNGHRWTVSYRECGLSAKARGVALRNVKAAIQDIERLAGEIGMVNVTAAPQEPEPAEEEIVYVPIEEDEATVEAIDYLMVTAPQGKPVIELWRDSRRYPELKWGLGADAFLKACPALQLTPQQLDTPSATQYRVSLEALWRPSPKNPKWRDIVAVRMRE